MHEETMHNEELKAVFDQQASSYEKQWERMAPIRDSLHFILESILVDLPENARILCVGVGTGAELAHLARNFPYWNFTVVEPSGAMLEICRQRAKAEGFTSRCYFYEGYLDSLPIHDMHDAAKCFLVSQFILDQEARSAFFHSIAQRLSPGGILTSSDLASEVGSRDYEALLLAWANMMSPTGIESERLERMRAAYAKDVAILPPKVIASIIESGGFEAPVQFFQAGLIHAWFSQRASGNAT
jgi:tRNA (cmo5U34)-methyltransferase